MEGLRFKFIRPTFRTTPNLCSRNCRTGPGNGQARLPGNGIVEGEDRNQSPVPEERYWHRRVNRERRARHLKTLLGTWGANTYNSNRNPHGESKHETQETPARANVRASKGWIRAPLPGFSLESEPASRKRAS